MTAVEEHTILEFRGRMLMMTVLHLKTLALDALHAQLDKSLEESPDWLRDVPIVLDLPADREASVVELALVLEALRDRDMNLVAVAAGTAMPEQEIRALGLGVVTLGDQRTSATRQEKSPPRSEKRAESVRERVETMVIDQPVRSGQQIYSRGDLIVLAPVGTGAELLADGHIHVYGNLRGRALAGVRGDSSARIFCQQLNAELVSIAGHYRVAEDLPESWRDQPVQISLDGEAMQFMPLKAR